MQCVQLLFTAIVPGKTSKQCLEKSVCEHPTSSGWPKDNIATESPGYSFLQAPSPDADLHSVSPTLHHALSIDTRYPPPFCRYHSQTALLRSLYLVIRRLNALQPQIIYPLAECLFYMPLVSFSNFQLCRSYSSGNVWYTRMFYLFLVRDGSRAMTSRVLRDAVLPGATALCYNILPCPELNSDFPHQDHGQIIRAIYMYV
jgi:hypothetical protein